jgi:hypothetical protein
VNTFHWMAIGFLLLVMASLVASVVLESLTRPYHLAADSLVWAATILSVFCVTTLVAAFLLELTR